MNLGGNLAESTVPPGAPSVNEGLRCRRAPGNFPGVSALPETPYAEYWPDAYRFALLMTGSVAGAQAAIQGLVPSAAERLTQMRDARQAKRWLFSQVRERCRAGSAAASAEENGGEGGEAASLFSHLPEEERAALILFYLHRFEASELAETLDLSPMALGLLLGRARQLLGRHWKAAPAALA